MTSRTFLTLFLFTTATAAASGCGGNGTGTGGTGAGGGASSSSSSGSSSSSSGSTSSSSGSSSTSSSSGGGTGGAPNCEDYNPPPPTGVPMKVRLVNNTTSKVYLGDPNMGCEETLGFTLEDMSMNPLKPSRSNCDFTCGELQMSSCACAPGCAAPSVTLIPAGGHYDIPWPGTIFVAEKMPASCFNDSTCAATDCFVEQAPPMETLTFRASAYPTVKCPNGPCNDCVPGSNATSCLMPDGTQVTGAEIKGSVTWTMGQPMAQIVFM